MDVSCLKLNGTISSCTEGEGTLCWREAERSSSSKDDCVSEEEKEAGRETEGNGGSRCAGEGMATAPVFLFTESHGQRSPGGRHSPWGLQSGTLIE